MYLPEVESRTRGSRPRTQKKSKAKDRLSEDRPSRGQGQECSRPSTKNTTRKCSQKKGLRAKIANFPWNFRRSKKKFSRRKSQIFCDIQAKQTGHNFGLFLTNQKIVLSSAEDLGAARPRTSKCVLEEPTSSTCIFGGARSRDLKQMHSKYVIAKFIK